MLTVGHKDVLAGIAASALYEGENLIDIRFIVGGQSGIAFAINLRLLHGEVVVGSGRDGTLTFSFCHRSGDGIVLQSELLGSTELTEPSTLSLS